MPKSKARRRRKPSSPRQVEAPRRRRWGWWVLFAVGLAMFLAGNIGARTGIAFPFDRHHLITQWGGGLLAGVSLMLATRP
jgi:hypothetical protein